MTPFSCFKIVYADFIELDNRLFQAMDFFTKGEYCYLKLKPYMETDDEKPKST